jgi:hypothetical protein
VGAPLDFKLAAEVCERRRRLRTTDVLSLVA